MVARNTSADVNAIAVIGERGREVREFIENDLGRRGSPGRCSSSPPPTSRRSRDSAAPTSPPPSPIRDQGKDVMLLFDSVTRFARAQREIGLSIGEPPATRGFTPSVFDSCRSSWSARAPPTGGRSPASIRSSSMPTTWTTRSRILRGILDGHIVLCGASPSATNTRRSTSSSPYPPTRRVGDRPDHPEGDGLRAQGHGGLRRERGHDHDRRLREGLRTPRWTRRSRSARPCQDFLIQAVEEKAPIADTIRRLSAIAGISVPPQELSAYAAEAKGGFLAGPAAGGREADVGRQCCDAAGGLRVTREGPAKREGPP